MTRRFSAGHRVVVAVAIAAGAACATAEPSHPTPPDAKAVARAEATVIDAAISELRKEYAAHVKDPAHARLRPQSNYFLDHPVQLSQESLLDALERPLGDDPRGAAYVKWQLLSGAPDKFGAKVLPRVLSAYEKAPAPPPRFGMSADDRTKLDAMLVKAKKEDDSLLSTRLEERVRTDAEENRPILTYRDALYARLPEGFDSVFAGFRDAHERTMAGAGGGTSDPHVAAVVKDAVAWAQSGTADAVQCGRLAELVARLRFVRSPPYYARAGWRYDHLAWSSRTDSVYSAKKLENLEGVLREAQKMALGQQSSQHAAQPAASQQKSRRSSAAGGAGTKR